MQVIYPEPQDLSHVTGGSTGVQKWVWRSKRWDPAIRASICPLEVAMAEPTPASMRVNRECMAACEQVDELDYVATDCMFFLSRENEQWKGVTRPCATDGCGGKRSLLSTSMGMHGNLYMSAVHVYAGTE